MKKDELILSNYIKPYSIKFEDMKDEINNLQKDISLQLTDLEELIERVNELSDKSGSNIEIDIETVDSSLADLNSGIIDKLDELSIYKNEPLTQEDILVGSIAGIIGVVIDVFLVGTPSTDNDIFDGSKLTELIRNVSESSIAPFLEKLESDFTVPYDLVAGNDGLSSNYHRLRSFSHDPFLGLFFAFFDFSFKTTTYINNEGKLVIKLNPTKAFKSAKIYDSKDSTKTYTLINLFESIYFFIGHILSDFSTSRGIPIPGFVLTQFITEENFNINIAKRAEKMYKDGYDLRHLSSMAVPAMVKKLIIDIYFKFTEDYSNDLISRSYDIESEKIAQTIKREKVNLVANSISVTGNVIKFLAPPNMCNPAALNVVEWYKFLNTSINNVKIINREKDTEQINHNRKTIDANWDKLLK